VVKTVIEVMDVIRIETVMETARKPSVPVMIAGIGAETETMTRKKNASQKTGTKKAARDPRSEGVPATTAEIETETEIEAEDNGQEAHPTIGIRDRRTAEMTSREIARKEVVGQMIDHSDSTHRQKMMRFQRSTLINLRWQLSESMVSSSASRTSCRASRRCRWRKLRRLIANFTSGTFHRASRSSSS